MLADRFQVRLNVEMKVPNILSFGTTYRHVRESFEYLEMQSDHHAASLGAHADPKRRKIHNHAMVTCTRGNCETVRVRQYAGEDAETA